MMRVRITLAVASLALFASLAFAEPAARVVYVNGVPRVELDGSWAGARYSVARAFHADGPFDLVLTSDALCTGDCYALDYGAQPGATHWYRFELSLPDGQAVSYGPFPIVISPEQARPLAVALHPNPFNGAATLKLTLAGRPGVTSRGEVGLYDIRGRRLATLHRGLIGAGSTDIRWDGRTDGGRPLGSGVYFIRAHTEDGRSAISRVVRVR
ncbi:MAG: hypothetical protein HOP12_11650 [Candidatus Eisenbacteria bacterium]|uniref:FlgD/Vpr Ig-like domain-containing protein n=1 Tax=Eiseniibacteriota bacterium TaxID=2212470 RepID=A0A849STU3_UNCEI|nr:hypothetical protein [Candidatus Eisenbacteria bacterium]